MAVIRRDEPSASDEQGEEPSPSSNDPPALDECTLRVIRQRIGDGFYDMPDIEAVIARKIVRDMSA